MEPLVCLKQAIKPMSFSDAETFSTKNLEAIRRLMLGPSERRKSLGHQYFGYSGIIMDLGVRYPRSSFFCQKLDAVHPRPQWFSLHDVASSTSSTLALWRRIWHTCGFVDVEGWATICISLETRSETEEFCLGSYILHN